MGLLNNDYPMVGFRYSVSLLPEPNNGGKFSEGSIATAAVAAADDAGFSEISGFSATLNTEAVNVGGERNEIELPDLVKFSPLVLKRGLSSAVSELVMWVIETLFNIEAKEIQTKMLILKLLSEQNEPLVYWVFGGAFPTKWSTSGLKAMSNELAIEELEIKYKFFFPVFLGM